MHVVLVIPPFDLSASFGSKKRMQLGVLAPLGVGYLAASLEPRGHTVTLIDAIALALNQDEAVDRILSARPDVIGISCVTKMAENAYAVIAALKARAPDIPVVFGGAHATSFVERVLDECPGIDFLVPGEGEITLADLVDRLAEGRDWGDLPGLVYREGGGQVHCTPVPEPVRDLDTLPNPARHIYQSELYLPLPNQARRKPATTVITSRGCPWGKCAFCYQGGRYAQPYRQRSAAHVVDELGHLVKDFGIREVIFWDDNFGMSRTWTEEFCRRLEQERLDITWTAQMRVNTVRPESLKRMASVGCYNVYYGFESGNQELLDMIHKGITLDEIRNAVTWAKQAGMEIRGSFILGLPTETPEMSEKTIRFACELNVDWMIFFPYIVRRGTPLEERALREGRVVDSGTNMHLPSYVPNTYASAEQLEAMVKRAYRRYYMRPAFIGRTLWQARKWSRLKNYAGAARIWVDMMRSRSQRP
ncbi:MAG TPA: radical SAM protein [Candidatus Hydrogenedentes bacterium]|nr:radical SAM protein [Candidatus Hydrogenedentota bacterium]HPG67297.1 radical SAM protein [Candidatus Hydrogenedentota bacterium]